jgi:hypothetical protein
MRDELLTAAEIGQHESAGRDRRRIRNGELLCCENCRKQQEE